MGMHRYIETFSMGTVVGYNVSNYVGIHDYFVRTSNYDDEMYEFDRDSDPWNRPFFAYKSGTKINMSGRYMCRPLVGKCGNILMYVMTTSVEGSLFYCLDVINNNRPHVVGYQPQL